MRVAVFVLALALGVGGAAQESKPVPKDSVRVWVPGCSKGLVFTAAQRTEEHPGSLGVREGTHLRMAGPKAVVADIRRREGSMIELVGVVRRNDLVPDGVSLGRMRIAPGPSMSGGGSIPSPTSGQVIIDVEDFRAIPGDCPVR